MLASSPATASAMLVAAVRVGQKGGAMTLRELSLRRKEPWIAAMLQCLPLAGMAAFLVGFLPHFIIWLLLPLLLCWGFGYWYLGCMERFLFFLIVVPVSTAGAVGLLFILVAFTPNWAAALFVGLVGVRAIALGLALFAALLVCDAFLLAMRKPGGSNG
jgi:hypothetical protein